MPTRIHIGSGPTQGKWMVPGSLLGGPGSAKETVFEKRLLA